MSISPLTPEPEPQILLVEDDEIQATFGVPVSAGNDAANALSCALAIENYFKLFNSVRPSYISDDLDFGIGIATGKVFAGTVGSYRRLEYTVLGDTVNTASRLQGLSRRTTEKIITDKATRDSGGSGYTYRRLSVRNLRGKNNETEIFALTGQKIKNDANEDTIFS